MELNDLSDEALRARLRSNLAGRKWSISEIIEVERRDLAVLDPDPHLAAAFREHHEKLLAPARKAYRKFDLGIQMIAQDKVNLGFDFTGFPEVAQGLHPEVIGALSAIAVHTGRIEGNTRRGWFDWAQFAFVIIAAVLSLVALL